VAVILVEEIHEGRGGSDSYDFTKDGTRRFRVITDDDADGPPTILASPALPELGFPYVTATESDSLLRVQSRTPEATDDPRVWHVNVRYTNKFNSQAPGGGSGGDPGEKGGKSPENREQDPLNEPVKWRLSFVSIPQAKFKDLDGKEYVNSAGSPYNPPREVTRKIAVITAVKNYSQFLYWPAAEKFGGVNSQIWKGFPKYSVKIEGLEIEEDFRNDVSFMRATWTFHVDKFLWIPTEILNKGTHYLDELDLTIKVPFVDSTGAHYEGLLDQEGLWSNTPTYRTYREYEPISFAFIP
jgi:hypothetical protein